jgi:hypothetical protein
MRDSKVMPLTTEVFSISLNPVTFLPLISAKSVSVLAGEAKQSGEVAGSGDRFARQARNAATWVIDKGRPGTNNTRLFETLTR